MTSISADYFGEIKQTDGSKKQITRFTLSNGSVEMIVMNYGATLIALKIPDKLGQRDDVVLGFDAVSDYINHPCYFGCTVGRYANRIARGQFFLENKKYSLAINNGPNHLHGGIKGFDKVIWDALIQDSKVIFTYNSPSMEENYPGSLNCEVTYELTNSNEMVIHYKATTTETTPVNLTNHSYFNLAGHASGKIDTQIISINADHYTPVDETMIPTGIKAVDSTSFDFRQPKSFHDLFKEIPGGFDHNFCINGNSQTEKKVASVHHPESGRCMEVYSTQPGVQLYTANFLPEDDSLYGKEGKCYKKWGAFCLETQNYPNAINDERFPKAFLNVEDVYQHSTKFSFSVK